MSSSSTCVILYLCICVLTLDPRPLESLSYDHYPPGFAPSCELSHYGCCTNGHTSAAGPRNEECPGVDCVRTRYTCFSVSVLPYILSRTTVVLKWFSTSLRTCVFKSWPKSKKCTYQYCGNQQGLHVLLKTLSKQKATTIGAKLN